MGCAASTSELSDRALPLATPCTEALILCDVIIHAVLYMDVVLEGFGLCNRTAAVC